MGRLLDADTAQVPEIVAAMRDYRRWVDPALRSELAKNSDDSRQKLHASLALLPVDASQVDYLFRPPEESHTKRTSRVA